LIGSACPWCYRFNGQVEAGKTDAIATASPASIILLQNRLPEKGENDRGDGYSFGGWRPSHRVSGDIEVLPRRSEMPAKRLQHVTEPLLEAKKHLENAKQAIDRALDALDKLAEPAPKTPSPRTSKAKKTT